MLYRAASHPLFLLSSPTLQGFNSKQQEIAIQFVPKFCFSKPIITISRSSLQFFPTLFSKEVKASLQHLQCCQSFLWYQWAVVCYMSLVASCVSKVFFPILSLNLMIQMESSFQLMYNLVPKIMIFKQPADTERQTGVFILILKHSKTFPVFCCPWTNLFETCCWHQNPNKHVKDLQIITLGFIFVCLYINQTIPVIIGAVCVLL